MCVIKLFYCFRWGHFNTKSILTSNIYNWILFYFVHSAFAMRTKFWMIKGLTLFRRSLKNVINFINSLFWVYLFFYFRAECDTISLIKFSISTTEFAVIFQQHRLIILAMNLISLQLNPARRRKIRSHTHTHTQWVRQSYRYSHRHSTDSASCKNGKQKCLQAFILFIIYPAIYRKTFETLQGFFMCVWVCERGNSIKYR